MVAFAEPQYYYNLLVMYSLVRNFIMGPITITSCAKRCNVCPNFHESEGQLPPNSG